MKSNWIRALTLIIATSWLPVAHAKPGFHEPFEVTGSAIKNHDGDTIKLQTTERGIIDVRLSGVDTPETGQAYWKAARGALRELVAGKPVTVWCYKTDKYDREVCHVTTGGADVGHALVKQGLAWYAFMFAAELTPAMREAYQVAETQARQQHIGLWQEPDPMPPWECRKLRKAHQKCR